MAISKIGSDALAAGAPSRSQLPAGTVLQVVQGSYGTQTTTSSSTFSDTGLTATITPSSATSKILVVVHHTGLIKQTGNTYAEFQLLRGASVVSFFESGAGYTNSTASNLVGAVSTAYLDSPGTTNATVYKTQFRSVSNIATVGIQNNNSIGTITLMEIAA